MRRIALAAGLILSAGCGSTAPGPGVLEVTVDPSIQEVSAGSPVFLEVSIRNVGETTVRIPIVGLDGAGYSKVSAWNPEGEQEIVLGSVSEEAPRPEGTRVLPAGGVHQHRLPVPGTYRPGLWKFIWSLHVPDVPDAQLFGQTARSDTAYVSVSAGTP